MSIYALPVIWIVAAGVCYYIAISKNILPSALWNIIFALLGPIAIPLILVVKNKNSTVD